MTSRDERIEELGQRFVEGQREMHEGNIDLAVAIFEELAADWADLDGADCDRALTMRGFLGRALTEARRFSEAEAVLADLLMDRERVLGPDDEQTLVTRGNLMRAIAFGGRPVEAIVLAERLVEDRTRIYGVEHESVYRMHAHIARFHYEMDAYAEAAERYAMVLEAFERLGLDDTYEFAEMSYNAAVCEVKADPNEETAAAFAEMVAEIEAELGPDDPWTLSATATWAEVLAFSLDDAAAAIPIYVRVLDRKAAAFGEVSPQTLETRRALARCLIATDRPGEAVAILEEGVRACEAIGYADEIGGLHTRMDLIWARMSLVARLREIDDPGEAGDEEIVRQWLSADDEFIALEEDSRSLEPDHGLRVAILDLGEAHGLGDDEVDAIDDDPDAADEPVRGLAEGRPGDERHMVHYKFGFGVIPMFVFDDAGLGFVHTLDEPGAPNVLAQVWASLCDDEATVADASEFVVAQRRAGDGDILVVIGLPEVRASHECHFVGIRVDIQTFQRRFSETRGLPSLREPGAARVIHLESTVFGGTVIGETTVDGAHLNLGMGPEPSLDAMFAVLSELGGSAA